MLDILISISLIIIYTTGLKNDNHGKISRFSNDTKIRVGANNEEQYKQIPKDLDYLGN